MLNFAFKHFLLNAWRENLTLEAHRIHNLLWTLHFTASPATKIQVWHSNQSPASSSLRARHRRTASGSGNSWTSRRSHLSVTSSISTFISVCHPPPVTFPSSTPAPLQASLFPLHSFLWHIDGYFLMHVSRLTCPIIVHLWPLTALQSLLLSIHTFLSFVSSSSSPGSLFSHYLFN